MGRISIDSVRDGKIVKGKRERTRERGWKKGVGGRGLVMGRRGGHVADGDREVTGQGREM